MYRVWSLSISSFLGLSILETEIGDPTAEKKIVMLLSYHYAIGVSRNHTQNKSLMGANLGLHWSSFYHTVFQFMLVLNPRRNVRLVNKSAFNKKKTFTNEKYAYLRRWLEIVSEENKFWGKRWNFWTKVEAVNIGNNYCRQLYYDKDYSVQSQTQGQDRTWKW